MEIMINEFGDGVNTVQVYFSTLTEKWNVSGYKWEANGFGTYEDAYEFAKMCALNLRGGVLSSE